MDPPLDVNWSLIVQLSLTAVHCQWHWLIFRLSDNASVLWHRGCLLCTKYSEVIFSFIKTFGQLLANPGEAVNWSFNLNSCVFGFIDVFGVGICSLYIVFCIICVSLSFLHQIQRRSDKISVSHKNDWNLGNSETSWIAYFSLLFIQTETVFLVVKVLPMHTCVICAPVYSIKSS